MRSVINSCRNINLTGWKFKVPGSWFAAWLLVFPLLFFWAGDSSARLKNDQLLEYCPGRTVLLAAGSTPQLDAQGYVISGVLARERQLEYCGSPLKTALFMAGSTVTFAANSPQSRCLVGNGVLAQDTMLEYSNMHTVLLQRGSPVTFRTSACVVKRGVLARNAMLRSVKKGGGIVSVGAGTTVSFNSKGLLADSRESDDERPSRDESRELSVSISPARQIMKSGEEVTTVAEVAGGKPPYKYEWFNNDKKSKVEKHKVHWTMNRTGRHIMRVIVTDSHGKRAEAEAQLEVVTRNQSPFPVNTANHPSNDKHTYPSEKHDTHSIASTQPKSGGWHLEEIKNKQSHVAQNTGAYFGNQFSMGDGSASGSMSWKTASPKCSGTYKGTVTWDLPKFMAGGREVRLRVTADTTHSNTCGYRNVGSGVHIKVLGFALDASCAGDAPANDPKRKVSQPWSVPQGGPGSRMAITVSAEAPGGDGYLEYHYVWK